MRPTPTSELYFGGLAIRVTAGAVDWLVRGIFSFPFIFDAIVNDSGAGDGDDIDAGRVILVLSVLFVLTGVLQGLTGWSPAKWLLKLRITTDDTVTTPPGLAAGLKRVIPSIAALVGLVVAPLAVLLALVNAVMVLLDPDRRSLHERIAGTYVVYNHRLPDKI